MSRYQKCPQTIFELSINSYRLLIKNFFMVALLLLAFGVVTGAVMFLGSTLGLTDVQKFALADIDMGNIVVYQQLLEVVGMSLILMLVLLLLTTYLWFTLSIYIYARIRGESISLKAACKQALQRYIMGNVVFAVCGLLIKLGVLLFIIPGIYLFVILAFFPIFLVIIDNKGFKESIKQSFVLTKGHWWRLFLALVVSIALFVLLFTGIFVLAYLVLGFFLPVIIINALVSLLYLCVFVPYPMIYWVNVYHDLKLRHEQGDVQAP